MNNKKAFFSTVFCIFIAALFILGCNNHLLKPQQDEPRLIVKIANSTGARNASTTENNVTAWIENQDGSQSHHQEISTKENNIILTFENIVIGSQINIHLELTKNDDSQTKLTGESGWITVKEGEKVIEIPLESQANTDDSGEGNGSTSGGETEGDEPAIVDAETPVITQEPHGKSQTFEPNTATSVTTTLEIDATVGDGGTLTYQWYSNTSNSTSGGTLINGATNKTYPASTEAKTTTYFYCIVTNTNNAVNGKTTASVTSHIAAVSSIEGTLSHITAHYTGTHELVNAALNYDNIEIEQTYTAGSETQVVTVSAGEVIDQYTIELQVNNGIGMVPATVTHVTETQIKDDFIIPVKYQLDASKLTISGNSSVDQNGTLSLTANYADTYTKYDGGSSTTYNVKDNVTIAWTGATAQSDDTWKAMAETSSAGTGKTATVTLTSTDGTWCVTTEGITASHEYEVIPLVNAEIPDITQQPEGQIQIFATGKTESVKKELAIATEVDDGGTLTYQWYSNTTNSTENGTHIENATNATYEAQVAAKETKYFYCVVTNTNNSVNGNKTASVTSGVVTVASIEGTLTGITAQYAGSQEYILVENSNFDGFTVTETYTGNGQTITNKVTSLDGQYNVTKPENAIGDVPVTITNSSKQDIKTTITIPVKYQLNASKLTISGDISVEQNGSLSLTANYADTYTKYDGGSSTTYNVKDNVNIAWTGATAQSDAWRADANTTSTGSKTATIKLTPKDEWCVTTGGVEKSHSYEVTSSATPSDEISTEEQLREAIENAQSGVPIMITQNITITDTIIIDNEILIDGNSTGKLLRSNKETITGPMFEVSNSGNLTLQNITLDGQYNDVFDDVENNPFIINQGTSNINNVVMENNFMYQSTDYKSITVNSGSIFSSGTLNIQNSTIRDITMNASNATNIFIASGSVTISKSSIEQPVQPNGTKYNVLTMGEDTQAFNSITYSINNKNSGLQRVTQTPITPDSP